MGLHSWKCDSKLTCLHELAFPRWERHHLEACLPIALHPVVRPLYPEGKLPPHHSPTPSQHKHDSPSARAQDPGQLRAAPVGRGKAAGTVNGGRAEGLPHSPLEGQKADSAGGGPSFLPPGLPIQTFPASPQDPTIHIRAAALCQGCTGCWWVSKETYRTGLRSTEGWHRGPVRGGARSAEAPREPGEGRSPQEEKACASLRQLAPDSAGPKDRNPGCSPPQMHQEPQTCEGRGAIWDPVKLLPAVGLRLLF